MTKQHVSRLGRLRGKWSRASKYPRKEIFLMQYGARSLSVLFLIAGLMLSWSCASHPTGDLAVMRQSAIPLGIKDAQRQEIPRRAVRAYVTSGMHSRGDEKQYATTHSALSKLPGVVAVRPGFGVVYVYTTQPAAVPKEFEGVPVKALPPEFANGVSEEWVTPDQLPPPGQGN